MTGPAFDERTVRALAIAESFARGRDYVRCGAVSRIVRRGDRLTAEVEGRGVAPYHVTIDLHRGGDEAVQFVEVAATLANPANNVFLRLTEAAHASHPDWVIDLCERMAAAVMDAGRSGSHEQAAQWLERAARL